MLGIINKLALQTLEELLFLQIWNKSGLDY